MMIYRTFGTGLSLTPPPQKFSDAPLDVGSGVERGGQQRVEAAQILSILPPEPGLTSYTDGVVS